MKCYREWNFCVSRIACVPRSFFLNNWTWSWSWKAANCCCYFLDCLTCRRIASVNKFKASFASNAYPERDIDSDSGAMRKWKSDQSQLNPWGRHTVGDGPRIEALFPRPAGLPLWAHETLSVCFHAHACVLLTFIPQSFPVYHLHPVSLHPFCDEPSALNYPLTTRSQPITHTALFRGHAPYTQSCILLHPCVLEASVWFGASQWPRGN